MLVGIQSSLPVQSAAALCLVPSFGKGNSDGVLVTEPWQAGAEGPHLLWLLVQVVESHHQFLFQKTNLPCFICLLG